MIARLICLFRGHLWSTRAINHRKHVNLMHLHPMAGTLALCKRCGSLWDDLGGAWFPDTIELVEPEEPDELPEARTLEN